MIRENIFNFSKIDKDSIRYRISLRNSRLEENQIQAEIFLRRDFEDLKTKEFLFLKKKKFSFLEASFYSSNVKNIISTVYNFNKRELEINKKLSFFNKNDSNWIKTSRKEFQNLLNEYEEIEISNRTKYNKVKVKSLFSEKDFEEKYDLYDFKKDKRLLKKEQCEFKEEGITIGRFNEKAVIPYNCYLLKEKSFLGDDLIAINLTKDAKNTYRKDKVFKAILGRKEESILGYQEAHKNVEIALLYEFDCPSEMNSISFKSCSSLESYFNIEEIKFFNLKTKEYEKIQNVFYDKEYDFYRIYFDSITTNKITVSFYQSKYFDLQKIENNKEEDLLIKRSWIEKNPIIEKEKILKVYDLSIEHIEFKNIKNKESGFYRSSEYLVLNQPLCCYLDYKKSYDNVDTFIEKYLEIITFGGELREANIYTRNIKATIPVGNKKELEREVLYPNKDLLCKVNLCPDISSAANIKVYRKYKNIVEELVLGENYSFSIDGGETFIEDATSMSEENFINKNLFIGDFVIKFTKENKKYNYYIEYKLNEVCLLNETKDFWIENGEVSFSENTSKGKVLVKPILMLRNRSEKNASSIISKYFLLSEETEVNKKTDNLKEIKIIENENEVILNVF